MDKRLFTFTSDLRLCLLYSLQHIGGNNPRLWESNPRRVLKEFITNSLQIEPFDNLVFMTLHFAERKRSIDKAIKRTHKIYARLWLRLQGRHWRKHPYNSITVVERGKGNILHVHTILNMKDNTPLQLTTALLNAYDPFDEYCGVRYDVTFEEEYKKCKNYMPIYDHILIKPIFDLNGLENYITKEFNWLLIKPKINFDNFWPSELLFRPIDKDTQKTIHGLHRRKRIV